MLSSWVVTQTTRFKAASILRDRGVPTRFIKFPRQQHGIREPRLLRVLHVEETRWMEKYIRGMDWEPWVREEK